MLPPLGTPARDALDEDAATIGIGALQRDGNIANALYAVYQAFRLRFLEERGLMDIVPGRCEASCEALTDARALEAHVCTQWASLILADAGQGRDLSIGD